LISNIKNRFLYFEILRTLLVWIIIFVIIFPALWLLIISVQHQRDLFIKVPNFIPKDITFKNYLRVISEKGFLKIVWNSCIVSGFTVLMLLGFGCPAAYAFARFSFRYKKEFLFILLASQLFPAMVFIIPYYMIFLRINLVGKHISLIIVNFVFTLPFVIWLLRSFFMGIPKELEEAAMIDGCSFMQVIMKITLPLAFPGLLVTAIFGFIYSWGEFLFALVLTNSNSATLPVKIQSYIGLVAVDYTALFVTGVLTTLPVALAALSMQKFLVKGMSEGGLKG